MHSPQWIQQLLIRWRFSVALIQPKYDRVTQTVLFSSTSEWRNLAHDSEMYLRDLEMNSEPQEMDHPLCKEWAEKGRDRGAPPGELNRSLPRDQLEVG